MPYMEKKSSSQTISNYIHYLQWFVKSPTRIRWKVGMEVLQKYHKVNEKELYKLYAIVVHSGYSSDGGHYFTYAKVPKKPGMADSSDCVDDL